MRLKKSRAVRYSSRPTRRSAEASRLLSCGCAHYRVQPGTARQLIATRLPEQVATRSAAPKDCFAPSYPMDDFAITGSEELAHAGSPGGIPRAPTLRRTTSRLVTRWDSSRSAAPKGCLTLGHPGRVTESPISPKGYREPSRPEGLPSCRCWQLSWSFLPLRRLSSGESTPPRLASPGTFRPQGFSPSRRITPRLNARPCFMPETPMGFRSPGGFPHRQVHRLVAAGLPS